ncbi:glycosyl hydrolase, family 31 [Dictyocaulus viviparus]|uniref:Glycosyl hydrolase, family 31 n=1 Tax=Dictyocaulus viviparus TaxID=29172 RepID=A0A0D8XH97_DICVI|nr:glycosyl hydrolase, family 31 [Dictyocaulus viviparus]
MQWTEQISKLVTNQRFAKLEEIFSLNKPLFWRRQRAITSPTGYGIVEDSVKWNDTSFFAQIKNKDLTLDLSIIALHDSTFRIVVDEPKGALRQRYRPLDSLVNREPTQQKLKKTKTDKEASKLLTEDGHRVVVTHNPFRVDFYSKEQLVISINSAGLLMVEPFKKKVLLSDREKGYWEETFKDHKDSKPYGRSSSIGLDISFIGMKFVFGIPEHAESFALRDTRTYEPYRLYNLDVFEYELFNPMALYGSVPYMAALNPKRSVGLLWLNAAETWIDIEHTTADKVILFGIADVDTSAKDVRQINTHFMSETGAIDVFITLGPQPHDSFRQLAALTGVYPLPPHIDVCYLLQEFALAYHQSRWNYNDQMDIKEVSNSFDEHNIPLDVLWLDIEHTDGKRYFTWDKEKFPNPDEMIEDLNSKGRKLVTIIDPHIKKDSKYSIYATAKKEDIFVKNKDGTVYEGNCWPGDSSYIDFINPEARKFWVDQFALNKYFGSTNNVYTWNDMNEPSVFSGPEVTMEKDLVHYGGLEHREVHNIYGLYNHESSFAGQLARSDGKLRPFVLTRSFFVGSQRTAAVWTGDNKADWAHLKATIPMLLSLSVAGIPHVGADVGGFFGDPDEELLIRWYQASAFQPFFRAHAHLDSKRREPWLFNETTTNAIRNAIIKRYQMLPYWYTLFYEHTLTGKPPMRPFWLEFSDDEVSYDEDRQWMVGNALLVKPIVEPKASQVSIYLPGKNEVWYDWESSKPRPSPGAVQLPTTLETIPMYQRGGTVIPVRENVQQSSSLMRNAPITLYIALKMKEHSANGTIYLDDGETYSYKNGEYAYWAIIFKREHDYLHTIINKNLDKRGTLDSDIQIEKIVIRGATFYPRTAHIYLDDFMPESLEFDFDRENHLMEIRNPNAYITKDFRIDLHS